MTLSNVHGVYSMIGFTLYGNCRNYVALEDSLTSCLEVLVSVLQDENNKDHRNNCFIMLKGLLKGISNHGLNDLRTEKLKASS